MRTYSGVLNPSLSKEPHVAESRQSFLPYLP